MYAKDVLDIDQFSSVKGVDIEGSDHEFAAKFSSGAVSKPWQEEVSENILTTPHHLPTHPHPHTHTHTHTHVHTHTLTQMIEMKVFDDINRMCPIDGMTLESNSPQSPLSPAETQPRRGWFKRLFRFKRQVSRLTFGSTQSVCLGVNI